MLTTLFAGDIAPYAAALLVWGFGIAFYGGRYLSLLGIAFVLCSVALVFWS